MTIKNPIFKQAAIFFGYLILSSLILFTAGEDAGIYFAVTIGISISVHVILLMFLVLMRVVKKNRKPPFVDLFTVILLANIFIVFSNQYLRWMWWIAGRN